MAACIIQAINAASTLDPPASEPNEGKRGGNHDASSEFALQYEILVQLVDVAAPSGSRRTQSGDAQHLSPQSREDRPLTTSDSSPYIF